MSPTSKYNFHFSAIILLLVTVLFLFGSCKKDKHDKLTPGSYYPVYPGSCWQYVDLEGNNIQVSVKDKYQLHSYDLSYGPNSSTSEPTYVPQLTNGEYIYRYKKVYQADTYSGYGLYTFLSEDLNASFTHGIGFNTENTFKTTSVDSTLVVNGISYYPTIEVSEYYHPISEMGEDFLRSQYYYTKDVGLIKSVIVNPSFSEEPPTIISEIKLIDYYIN